MTMLLITIALLLVGGAQIGLYAAIWNLRKSVEHLTNAVEIHMMDDEAHL